MDYKSAQQGLQIVTAYYKSGQEGLQIGTGITNQGRDYKSVQNTMFQPFTHKTR